MGEPTMEELTDQYLEDSCFDILASVVDMLRPIRNSTTYCAAIAKLIARTPYEGVEADIVEFETMAEQFEKIGELALLITAGTKDIRQRREARR